MNASDNELQQRAFTAENLAHPGTFPHAVTQLQLHETHVSRVVLTGQFAYKIKKAIQLDFIDARSLARRRELCELELRLNRRTAPALYLRVVPIVRDVSGRVRFGGEGEPFDYAVCMQQFSTDDELQNLLVHDAVSVPEMRDLGIRLAEFHDDAQRCSGMEYGGVEPLHAAVKTTLQHLQKEVAQESLPIIDRLRAWTEEQLPLLSHTIEARQQSGAVRECHGDLHARNVVRWHGQLIPFDCLEFDPQLRFIDVMNDVAFLVMDLVSHERVDLAHAFLSAYLETGGDYQGVRLLPFYAVYRASVRAMVDAIGMQQMPAKQTEYQGRLQQRLQTALQFVDHRRPALLIMHGPSGSGKTWASERLISALPAVRIRSDVERQRLVQIDATDIAQHSPQDRYSRQFTRRTYAHLLICAEACLQGGVSIIVDAAFLDVEERQIFHDLSKRLNVGFVIVSCHATPEVLAQRIETRREQHTDVSEATVDVLKQQLRQFKPLTEAERPHAVPMDTGDASAVAAAIEQIKARLTPSRD